MSVGCIYCERLVDDGAVVRSDVRERTKTRNTACFDASRLPETYAIRERDHMDLRYYAVFDSVFHFPDAASEVFTVSHNTAHDSTVVSPKSWGLVLSVITASCLPPLTFKSPVLLSPPRHCNFSLQIFLLKVRVRSLFLD